MNTENMKKDAADATEDAYAKVLERQNEVLADMLKSSEQRNLAAPTRTDTLRINALNTALHCHKGDVAPTPEKIIRDADEIYAWLISV